MIYDIAVYSLDGNRLNFPQRRISNPVLKQTKHGVTITFNAYLSPADFLFFFNNMHFYIIHFYSNGELLGKGRLEDLQFSEEGNCTFTALGYWRALNDYYYTAFWSNTLYDGFKQTGFVQQANRVEEKFNFDTTLRLQIGLVKNATYVNGADVGSFYYDIPYGSVTTITGVQFDYSVLLPANWNAVAEMYTDNLFGGGNTVWTLTASGVVQSGTIHLTPAAGKGVLSFSIYNNTGANQNYAGENAAAYLRITNLRFTGSPTNVNRVNTTISSPAGPFMGSTVVTPASMANIYVGQRLHIKQGGATGAESVIVTAVTATTFTATFVNNHIAGEAIQALVIYADEVVKHILDKVTLLNPSQLSTSTALIQSPVVDLFNRSYEDQPSDKVVEALANEGDFIDRIKYETGVYEKQLLYFRPVQTVYNTWYVSILNPKFSFSLADLYNAAYVKYKDTSDVPIRSPVDTDIPSINRYGLERIAFVNQDTTNATLALFARLAEIVDNKDLHAKIEIKIDKVYNAAGARAPLHSIRNGDVCKILNLPAIVINNVTLDRMRTFIVFETSFDLEANRLTVTPDQPLNYLDYLVASTVDFTKGFVNA